MRIKLGKLLAVVLAACMTLSSVSLSALMDPDKLPSEGGELANYSYTLTDDIDLTGGYIVTHNVTIDLNGHTIKNVMEKTRQSDGDLTMFTVRNGATLTINDSSADNSGKLDQNSKNDRTIRVDGNGYMVSSTNQWVNSAASSLTINGGQFVNSTDGVVYANGSGVVVTLNGGTLKNNTTTGNGGAICVDGGGKFIMNGGTIEYNTSTGVADANGSWGHVGGGGIYVGGNMTMSGGTVSNNTAGAGGGIFVNAANPWNQGDYFNTFEMTGGVVTGNTANEIEGGGVRIGVSVDATFRAASGKTIEISGNQTTSDTDWGGGGIFITEGGKATMYDTLITGNSADGFGGGLTGCPTAHNYVMSTDGAAIFGNTAEGTQDVTDSTKLDSAFSDAVFTRPGKFYQDYFCNLKSIISDTMLGGGSERWEGTIDSVEVKFGPGETRISSSASGLTAYPTDADMDLARSRAEIYVQNNHSDTHGGGILNNGMLFFGETPTSKDVPTYLSIPVEKNIDFPDENYVKEIKDKFKFVINLIDITLKDKDGKILKHADEKDSVQLDSLNDGTYRDPEDGNTKKFESEDVTITGEGAGRFDTIIYDDTLNNLPVNYVKYNRDDSSRPAGNPDYIIKETSSEGDVIAYWYYYRTGADNVKTYTYRIVEFEESDGKSQTGNKNEYELDKTEWRVEVDVASDPIYDEDITKFFNLDRYITVRDVRIYRMVPDEVTGELKPEEHEGETITTPSFTNRLKTGDLKVEKKTVIENENGVENYDTDDTFSFTVTLKPALNGTFGDMKFKDGEATFKLGNGEQKTATGLPIGVHYTVTEDDNDKYSSEITGASGDIVKDTTATVTATNTVKTGSLSITKKLDGDTNDEIKNKTFKFTVEGPNNYKKEIELKNNETKTLSDLVPGEYTITETGAEVDGYTLEVTVEGTATVVAEQVAEIDVTNTYTQNKGSLTVSKTVVGGVPGADTKEFNFTVTGPNDYSTTFKLKNGESKTLSDLVPGKYNITESNTGITGYSVVTTGVGEVTVEGKKETTVDVTNTYTQDKGSLTVSKTVVGGVPGADTKEFNFTVTGPNDYSTTFKLKNGESKTLSDLVPGKYTITESNTGITGYSVVTTGVGEVTVEGKKETTVDVTNTYTQDKGSLTVSKTVVGSAPGADTKEFDFTVTGPNGYKEEFTLKHNESKTLSDLVPGKYNITESNTGITGYSVVTSGVGDVTVEGKKETTVDVTNTYTQDKGSLTVSKTVVGSAPGADTKEFNFTVTGPNGYNETVTIIGAGEETLNDLVPGEYTVTENKTSAQITGYTLTVDGEGKATVSAEDVANVTIVNTYTQKPGSLKIVKSVEGGGEEAANKTFTFTVTGTNYSKTVTITGNGEKKLDNLVPGEYTVTEQDANIDGYTLEVTGNGETKTVNADQVAEFYITNTYTQKLGSLKIVKSVEGGGDEAANKTFTFTVTGPDEFSNTVTIIGEGEAVLENLVPGEYTVTEQDANIDGYTLEVTGNGETKTVTADQVAEFYITNTYTQKLGSLKIVKSVVGGGDEAANKTFTFTVTGPDGYNETVTVTGAGTVTLENLVPGEYTVTEDTASAEVEGYTLSVTGNGSTATIAADGNAEVTVTNNYTRKAGDLSVTKTLAGPVTDDDMAGSYNITVTLTNADGSPYSGNYTLSGAEYEYSVPISLVFTGFTSDSKNKTIQISGLPVGTRYTVTETAVDETFNVSYTAVTGNGVVMENSVSGSITETLSMATVTNTKKETERFALNVTKTVEGAVPAEPFKFNVTFYIKTAEGIAAPAGAVLGADGAGNVTYAFEIPANSTVSFTGVPKGTYYEITESPAEGYTLINQSLTSGTLLGNAEATFVNKENVRGSLSIVKELIGEGNALNAYNVNVTLTYPDERGVVSEVVTLTPGMPKIYEDLPVGTAFEVSETAESADGYNVSVSINGGGYVPGAAATGTVTETAPVVSVAVRNEKEAPRESSLTVIKTVRGDNIDPTRAFNFTVTLTDTTINGVYGEMEFVNGVASFALAGGQSKSADKLPEGIGYTVKELDENLDGYTTEYPANATGILSSESSAVVEVINTTSTLPGSLSVTKQVTGNGAEMGRTFMFTVMLNDPTITGQYGDMYFNGGVATIYLAHGMRATATGLPAGVGYNVIENDYGDYIPQAINPTGVIPDNGSAEVVYINHRDEQLGSLSVSKTVEGEGYDPEQEFTFTVTINDPTVNGQYGDMFFSGGVATLTLKAGRTATATNLPADTGYTVTEAPVENYTSAATGDVGIIPAGNGAYAQFVNTYEAPKVGGFSLMKIVSGTAADPNRYFTFQVILSDATINGVYGDLAFADGFSTVFLRHGDIVYCDNLPEGTGYTVIELDADDYEVSCNAPAGTIVSGETGEIIFENHKDVPPPPPPPEIPENEENPHGDDMNAGVGGDRDRHGDDMNAGVGMDDMNPATGDFMSESFMNGMAMLSAIVAAIAAFGAAVLIRKRKKD